ncbi:MAG: glycosyltransferase family 4 protein [Myxococcota bacterium]
MTRLAYVCTDPGVPVCGPKGCSIHVREVLRQLVALGVEVHLLGRGLEGLPLAGLDGIEPVPLPDLPGGAAGVRERAALECQRSVRAELERRGPFDVVYERYALWSSAAMEYARDARTPGLLEVNAPLVEEQARYRTLHDPEHARRVSARVFEAASDLLAVSEEVARYLGELTPRTGRIHVVANGVDPDRFDPLPPASEPAPPGGFTVGFVGRLQPWHGLSILARAFAKLHASDPSCRLLVVGDGPARKSLETELARLDLGAATRLVGQVPPEAVPGLLASMDVAVAPYPELDGFYFSPLKLYEYMAAGVSVIASRIGQIQRVITDGVDGLLCPPGDASALAASLARLREDPQLARRLGSAARRRAREEHSWRRVAERILEIACLRSSPDAVHVRESVG